MIVCTEIVRTINIKLSPTEAKAVQSLVTSNPDIDMDAEARKLASDIFNGLRIQLNQIHKPLEEAK